MEDRLGLVVKRVADRDHRGSAHPGDFGQPIVAGAAGVGLEMAASGRLPRTQDKRQAERPGQRGHKRGIGACRLAPHAVVEMRDR